MKNSKDFIYSIVVRVVFIAMVLCLWEYTAHQNLFGDRSELIFPSLGAIGKAFINNFTEGYAGISFWVYISNSLRLLVTGLAIGVFASFILSGLSMISRGFYHIFNLVVSIFDLLPGVALLPVVIIMFGIKEEVIILLVVHAVVWPMSRNVLDGFMAVPKIYIEAGTNMGLKGLSLLTGVYLPAAMSYIISGLKVGWARAWRGLLSAEMIFGIATCPGIGLYINQMRTNMNNASMYATLIVIIIIGLVVQYGILTPIENCTVKKWGMSK